MKTVGVEGELLDINDWDWGDIATEVPDLEEAYKKACTLGARTMLEEVTKGGSFNATNNETSLLIEFYVAGFDHIQITDNLTDLILLSCESWHDDDTRLMVKLLREVADKAESKIGG